MIIEIYFMVKRKAKQGYVYLLKSNVEHGVYKYGCTTASPEHRCKQVNRQCNTSGYDFFVLKSIKVKDCFKAETNIKWSILAHGMGAMSEVISIELFGGSESDLISKFTNLAGVK